MARSIFLTPYRFVPKWHEVEHLAPIVQVRAKMARSYSFMMSLDTGAVFLPALTDAAGSASVTGDATLLPSAFLCWDLGITITGGLFVPALTGFALSGVGCTCGFFFGVIGCALVGWGFFFFFATFFPSVTLVTSVTFFNRRDSDITASCNGKHLVKMRKGT